jgi:hypothetical protein
MRKMAMAAACIGLLATGAARAQTGSELPVKAGLWREDVTTTITGIQGVKPDPQTSSNLACISLESWKRSGLQGDTHCEVTNLRWDAHRMSYDTHCGGSDAEGFQVNITIDGDERMHGMAVAKFPAGAKMTSTVTEKYVSADCGDLKPGEKKPTK